MNAIVYRRAKTMSRQRTKTDDMRREHYFTKMIENAENAAGNTVFTPPSMSGAGASSWSSDAAGSRFHSDKP